MPDSAPDAPTTTSRPSAGWLARGSRAVAEIVGLDTRSLAAVRISLGVLCLLDVIVRFSDLAFFYSDRGALPRVAVIEELARWEHVSAYMASGTTFWAGLLLAVQGLAAVAFALGWRTRLSNAALWFLVISLHARGGILLQSGDVVLRLLLFWAMWLPMGARLSVDALRARPTRPAPALVTGAASLGYGLQLAVVYTFTAILKSDRVWGNGEAVYYALQIDHFAKQPFADWMLSHPELLELLTPATWYWEIAGPFLLLVPVLRGPARTAVVGGFVALHLGFWAGLEIGLFPWICIAGWLGLLPGWFWDRVGWRVAPVEPRWLGDPGPPTATRRRALPAALHTLGAGAFVLLVLNWNLSTLDGRRWAVPEPARSIGHLLRIDQKWNMFAPYPLKDDGWYAMPGRLADDRWVDVWRGGEPDWATDDEMTGWPDNAQPQGPKGSPKDSLRWLSRAKPPVVSEMYENQRWRKYMRNLWLKQYKDMRLYFGQGMCRQYNAHRTGADRLHTFEIWYMKEVTGPPDEGERPVEPVRIWSHYCYKTSTDPT